MEPAQVPRTFQQAFHLMRSGRPGPVWIDIPLDVQAAQIEPEHLKAFQPEPLVDDSELVANGVNSALELIAAAERPVLRV